MNGRGTKLNDRQKYAELAFVALRYALGYRESKLLTGLLNPGSAARKLAKALGHNDRTQRAHILATDLEPIISALDKMRVVCQ